MEQEYKQLSLKNNIVLKIYHIDITSYIYNTLINYNLIIIPLTEVFLLTKVITKNGNYYNRRTV
jgi:hypothetical protein